MEAGAPPPIQSRTAGTMRATAMGASSREAAASGAVVVRSGDATGGTRVLVWIGSDSDITEVSPSSIQLPTGINDDAITILIDSDRARQNASRRPPG